MNTPITVELDTEEVNVTSALRGAFGCFTTGVTVVTAQTADGRRVGLTANSFTSVSLDPPLALACVDLRSASLPVIDEAGSFAVNVLHVGQQDAALQFTRKVLDRFENLALETWHTGAPILTGCMANFECKTYQMFDAGDHRVYIGRIIKLRYHTRHDPLVYLQGRFRRMLIEN